MVTQISLGDIAVDVVRKNIKNIHLSMHPPTGRVHISAPLRMNVVHELVHLLERSHNVRFTAFMAQFMPKWHFYRNELNRLPIAHEQWRN